MMTVAIRILYVDDESDLLEFGKGLLERSGDFTVKTANGAHEAIGLLEHEKFDAIISGYQMPVMDGIQFLVEVRRRFGEIPFILFTGKGREELVIEAFNSGADFYIKKTGEPTIQFAQLKDTIKKAVKIGTMREAFQDSEIRYRRLFETAQDGILILDAGLGQITDVNQFLINLLGYTRDEMLEKKLWEIGFIRDKELAKQASADLKRTGYIRYDDLPLETKDGRAIDVEFVSNAYLVGDKKVIQCNIRDITDRKKIEVALNATETRYRRLFETAQDGILILDAETGQIVEVNPFLIAFLGFSREQFLGKKIWEIGLFKDIVANKDNFEELQRKESIRYENLPLETADGRNISVEFVSNVYMVDNKKVIQCNIRDITDRKVIQYALQASETRYRHLFENAQDAILLLDGNTGEIIDANTFILDMLGYPLSYFVGKHLWELGFIKDKSIAQLAFTELKTNSYIRYEDIPLETKDGRSIDVEFISNAYLVGDKKIIQCNIRNITDRKRVEETLKKYSDNLEAIVSERTRELREAQEELVKKERFAVLGKLSGVVGHELRNPLGAIKNVAYFLNLALENPDEEIREMIGILNKEVARSEDIISSLLDFARPKAPVFTNADVNHVMAEALKRFQLPHNITMVNTMSSTLPEIQADANQLLQVFSNLIINAVQAMPEGGILTITSNEHTPGWIAISVADTGMGICEENRKKLFEPLFTTKAKGLGLGLVVIKTIIGAHGGRIEVKSEAGKGAAFTVTLPIHDKEGGVK